MHWYNITGFFSLFIYEFCTYKLGRSRPAATAAQSDRKKTAAAEKTGAEAECKQTETACS